MIKIKSKVLLCLDFLGNDIILIIRYGINYLFSSNLEQFKRRVFYL